MGFFDKLFDDILGFDPPKPPKIPRPDPTPKVEQDTGMNAMAGQMRKRKRGRAGTVMTGSLIPSDVQERTLLG